MNLEFHKAVLKEEILTYIQKVQTENNVYKPDKAMFFLDGTLGDGGHSSFILENFPSSYLWATDRDEKMCQRAMERLESLGMKPLYINNLDVDRDSHSIKKIKESKIIIWNSNFCNLSYLISKYTQRKVDFILLDFGVASYHFLEANRGFSFKDDTLDMRLENSARYTAKEVVNTFSFKNLLNILSSYGEQKYSKTIAQTIIKNRPILSGEQLADLVEQIIYKKTGYGVKASKTHPATAVFQALRIYVNQEFKYNQKALTELPHLLDKFGCIAAISFHSLEDKIVKTSFKNLGISLKRYHKYTQNFKESHGDSKLNHEKTFYKNKNAEIKQDFIILTEKPIKANKQEIEQNPSSRCALLRVLQKIRNHF